MEISYYWSDTTVGDGVYSPYRNDKFSDIWRKLLIRDRTLQGYIDNYENELEVTWTGGDAIRIDTGAALVDGKFYENDAAIPLSISSPIVATRYDRVVLRKTWNAQTVRVAIVEGEEGSGVPSITQEDENIWEVPLATIRITTAGAITITDEREAVVASIAPNVVSNFEEIETVIGNGTSGYITFNNIPQTYTHLYIIGQGKSNAAAILETLFSIQFNTVVGASYEFQLMKGQNATASASSSVGATGIYFGYIPAGTSVAKHAAIIEILIPNYTNTDFNKQTLSRELHMPNTTLADFSLSIGAGQINISGTNAITRIDLIAQSGNWINGSTFTLYGMN